MRTLFPPRAICHRDTLALKVDHGGPPVGNRYVIIRNENEAAYDKFYNRGGTFSYFPGSVGDHSLIGEVFS
jgi:hypothetical protein